MFSGIVQSVATIREIKKSRGGARLVIAQGELPADVKAGSSVCVSGVCLTVAEKKSDCLSFDLMAETLSKTTIGFKKKGDKVNLEPALRLGDELSGHFVYGHADGVGMIARMVTTGADRLLTIKPPRSCLRWIVPQGSVAIDGVSLTVAKRLATSFTVSLVPYTVTRTSLGSLCVGDRVNLEADMVGKYCVEELKRIAINLF